MMNKYFIISVMAFGLSACNAHQTVSVAKATDASAVPSTVEWNKMALPASLPSQVTAICRDGSYSFAQENVCAGKGGVATQVYQYHSE